MTIDQLVELPEAELAWQLMAALEAADHEMDPWVEMVGLVPGSQQAIEAWEVTHTAYAAAWLRLGDVFHVKLWPLADQWRERQREARRNTHRTGLANRLTRAFARAS